MVASRARDYEDSIRRAFVDGRADYIVIDNFRDRFLIEGAMYGFRRGWLVGHWHGRDEQDQHLRYRLTDDGRKYFGLAGGPDGE